MLPRPVSYSVYLSGPAFDPKEWERRVIALTSPDGPRPLLPLLGELAQGYLLGGFTLIVEGGIRGLWIVQQDNSLLVEVRSYAGRTDWALMFEVVRLAKELGATIEEDNDFLSAGFGADRVDYAFKKWWETGGTPTEQMAAENTMILPVWGAAGLVLSSEMISMPRDELEKLLCEKVRIMGNAYPASAMQFERPDGKTEVLGTWGEIPTLMPGTVERVFFPGRTLPGEEIKFVSLPLRRLIELLGPDATNAGFGWLLPEADPETQAGAAILERLYSQAESVEKAPTAADHRAHDTMKLFENGPLYILAVLMGTDRLQMAKDSCKYEEILPLVARMTRFGEFFSAAAMNSFENYLDTTLRILDASNAQEILMGPLTRIGEMIPYLPPEMGTPYRDGLLYLGQFLTDASGRFFSSEKKRKKQLLQLIRAVLTRGGG